MRTRNREITAIEKYTGKVMPRGFRINQNPVYRCAECRDTGMIHYGRVLGENHPFHGKVYKYANPCGLCTKGRELSAKMSTCEKCHSPLSPSDMKCTDVKCKKTYPQRDCYVDTFHALFPNAATREWMRGLLDGKNETAEEQNPPDDGTEPFDE